MHVNSTELQPHAWPRRESWSFSLWTSYRADLCSTRELYNWRYLLLEAASVPSWKRTFLSTVWIFDTINRTCSNRYSVLNLTSESTRYNYTRVKSPRRRLVPFSYGFIDETVVPLRRRVASSSPRPRLPSSELSHHSTSCPDIDVVLLHAVGEPVSLNTASDYRPLSDYRPTISYYWMYRLLTVSVPWLPSVDSA